MAASIDMSIATREIMWNVSSIGNVVTMYSLFALSLVVALVGLIRHSELVLSGKPAPEHQDNWWQRTLDLISWGGLQKGVVREPVPGVAHTLIYLGFLVLLFTTTMVFIDHDLGIKIYQGDFYLLVTFCSDLLGFLLLLGCGIMAHRRYIQKKDLLHNRFADAFLLASLALLVIQGFLLEGLRIKATSDPWAAYSPIGLGVSRFFWFMSDNSATLLHFWIWWFHTITVFAVMAVAPYTKFLHVIASSINLFFRRSERPIGQIKSPGDLEQLMESGDEFSIGLGNIKDYSWKQLLDLEACTSCGRCQDVCPAYNSGKILSPKWLMLDTRHHAAALNAKEELGESVLPSWLNKIDSFLTKSMFLSEGGNGEYRASNSLVQNSVVQLGSSADDRIAGGVIDADVFWSCTTCMACVEACPVGINHVDQIVQNRQNMVLMEGEVPSEAQAALRALENRGNPYGPAEDRANWAEGLDVPILKEGDSVDYLYWVGCVSAFDPRKQSIARALVTILNEAGVSYGILGKNECCTGDPARRLGEENLFQTLAKQNIASIKSINFNKIVANCPHCFNTLLNEYGEFGLWEDVELPPVVHHTQLIAELIDEGKITPGSSAVETTFHDPCYLGRYNREFDAPRKSLSSVKGLKILEMDESKEKGMCCGAGGGHFWMDMKVGERVNSIRTDQAAATGAKQVATGCPFCLQMMEDGVKLTEREESLEVRDIAEIVADSLANSGEDEEAH